MKLWYSVPHLWMKSYYKSKAIFFSFSEKHHVPCQVYRILPNGEQEYSLKHEVSEDELHQSYYVIVGIYLRVTDCCTSSL